MAQLRDTVVAGSLRATDTLFSTTAQFQILRVPTSSNGTTFGPGSNNNLLKSNGTSVYWTTLVASDIPTISITDKTSGTLPVNRGGTGVITIANIQAGKDGDGNTISSTYLKLSGGTMTGNLTISHATNATMTADSTNPKITFSESGGQPVHLVYTDYDSYRNPAGLKIVGGTSATPAWFEVEGQVYAAGFNGPLTGNVTGNVTGSSGSCTGNAATATKLSANASNTTASFWRGDNTWSNQLANHIFNTTDIPEGAANLSATATSHKMTFYRNGITIPYQMDNTNDGGILRVRGASESDCIFELGTWDDSGSGETIQFNYYPTTSQATPTYSVSVPKASGTICLTNGTGASGTWGISVTGNAASATYVKDRTNSTATYLNYGATGISSDSITWLACWNGYELRAIAKDQILMRYAWWNVGDSHNANDLHGGITFAYPDHANTATVGTLVDFSCGGNNGYPLQIQGCYNSNELFYRNRNGDQGTWNKWLRVVTGISVIPGISYPTVTPNYTDGGETFFKAAIKYLVQNYKFEDNLMGILCPNSQGPFIGNVYSFTDVSSSTGLPRYSTFIYHNLGDGLESFGTVDYNFYYRRYLHSGNYTDYTVTKTGSGASGTWGINVTGSAGSVSCETYGFRNYGLNAINIESTRGDWVVGLSEGGHGYNPTGGWCTVVQFDCLHFLVQFAIPVNSSSSIVTNKLYVRSRWANNNWSNAWAVYNNDAFVATW